MTTILQKMILKNTNLLLGVYLLIYVLGLISTIGLNHSFWTDEAHFYRTITLFYNNISIYNLLHYNEMSTPLPFLLYSGWAKLGGLNIAWLRLLSLIIAVATYLLFNKVCQHYFSKLASLCLTIFLSLNPYMLGTSFFVYTDMVTVLCVVAALYFIQKENAWLIALSCTFAIWSRQYIAFFVAAVALYYFILFIKTSNKQYFNKSLIVSISVLSIIPLFILWGGFTPINEMKNLYLDKKLFYQLNGLTAYIIAIAIYSLPILAYTLLKIRNELNIKIIILISTLSFLYYLAPIAPSACGVEAGFLNIGFADKLITKISPNQLLINILYQVLFGIGLVAIYAIVKNISHSNLALLGMVCIIFFLLIMPFSYLVWEKYLLPLLPVLIIAIANQRNYVKIK